MERCECASAGFCNFYKQEMTYDPPNWQWCRDASPEDRAKYKISCEKKQAREAREKRSFLEADYITNSQLIKDCKDLLLPKIANLNLKGVIGIPRSGMFPASMIAMWLNLPMYYLDTLGSPQPLSAASRFGGIRMLKYKGSNGSFLVVDDTIYNGKAMKNFMPRILEDIYTCSVYVRPESEFKPDFYARELKAPHLLEWNLFNCTYIEYALLDFDGILCPNVPQEDCKDEDKYIDYISTVEPFYHRIPKTKCVGIVTARLEKYRAITEAWLKRHGINYGFLEMYPTEKKDIRDKNHIEESSTFKAKIFKRSHAKFFIESEIAEATRIKEKSGKFVVCPS
tara:strand:- start:6840 stop:7856 length:1017 start_codon:yes stop_codon:yes gene_type:complete